MKFQFLLLLPFLQAFCELLSISSMSVLPEIESDSIEISEFEDMKRDTDAFQEKAKIGLDLLDFDGPSSAPTHRQFGFREKSFVNFRKKYTSFNSIPLEKSLKSDIQSLLIEAKAMTPKLPMYMIPHRFFFSGFDSHLMKETVITLITEKKWILEGLDIADIMVFL